MTSETQNTGPVTIDDVRAALGETDPSTTNANKIRVSLGRGSQSTIQKHLDLIRAELSAAAAPALEATAAPEVPKELTQAIWSAAWNAAQAKTAGALAQAQAQAVQQAAALATAQADTAAAQQEVDSMADALAAHQAQSIQQQDNSLEALAGLQQEAQAQAQQIAELRQELAQQAQEHAQEAKAGVQAQELSAAKAGAIEATLRGELDRHISQLADLRAALGKTDKKAKPEQGSIL